MTEQHEHFSEQIGLLARGELAPADRAALEAHLDGCRDCQAELKGVRALLGVSGAPDASSDGPMSEPMNEIERARLHRSVLGATTGEQTGGSDTSARRGMGARIAPALGAAALFALFAFGATQLFTGMGDQSESSADAGAGMAAEGSDDSADAGPLGLPPSVGARSGAAVGDSTLEGPESDAAAGGGDGGEATQESTSSQSTFAAAPPQPYFEPGPRVISEPALRRLGSQRDPFQSFSFSYRAGDGTDRDALTTALAMGSPEPAEVRTCAAGVLDLDPNALPAYGTLGTLDGEYVLALGFVTARRGPLDRYEIRVWTVGDCMTPIARFSGRI